MPTKKTKTAEERASERCGDCRHYEPLGTEDSGVQSASGDGTNWHYVIGRCALPMVLGCPHRDNIPEWLSCYRFKRKRAGRKPKAESPKAENPPAV